MTQLRACPGSLSRITELSQHASDGRKSEDGQCIAVEVLNIFGESTAAVELGDCALNYPAFWEDLLGAERCEHAGEAWQATKNIDALSFRQARSSAHRM
jgi:hypothetical protein